MFQIVGSKLKDVKRGHMLVAAAFIVVAGVWSSLPILVNHWTFPPNDDPLAYARMVKQPFWALRHYYGHDLARFVSLTYYYYITPLLTAVALMYALRRYGAWMAFAVWVAVWMISRVALFDMYAGTFIAVLGIYATAIVGARVFADYLDGKQYGIIASAVVLAVALYHNSSSVVFLVGLCGVALIYWRRRPWAFAVLVPGLAFSALRASMPNNGAYVLTPVRAILDRVPAPMYEAVQPLAGSTMAVIARAPDAYVVDFTMLRFIGEYVGPSLTALVFLGAAAAVDAYLRGWRPRVDPFVVFLVVIVVTLPLFVFTPLSPNADRMAKMLVGHVAVLSMVATVAWLRFRADGQLTIVISVLIVGLAITGMLENVPYWLAMGRIL